MKSNVYSILIFCVSLWASNFIIGVVLVNYWPALHVAIYRLICISLFLGVMGFPVIRRAIIRRGQWLLLSVAAILGVSINHVSFFKSLETTSPITAAYILALTPIMTGMINRVVRGERKSWLFWLGSIISFVGVGFIISAKGGSGPQFGIGEVFSFCTMTSFAIFTTVPIKQAASMPMIALLIISAIFVHGVSNLLWNAKQHEVGSTNAAILLNLEPIITMVLSALFLHAIIQSSQIVGGILVLSGIAISVILSDKKQTAS